MTMCPTMSMLIGLTGRPFANLQPVTCTLFHICRLANLNLERGDWVSPVKRNVHDMMCKNFLVRSTLLDFTNLNDCVRNLLWFFALYGVILSNGTFSFQFKTLIKLAISNIACLQNWNVFLPCFRGDKGSSMPPVFHSKWFAIELLLHAKRILFKCYYTTHS